MYRTCLRNIGDDKDNLQLSIYHKLNCFCRFDAVRSGRHLNVHDEVLATEYVNFRLS